MFFVQIKVILISEKDKSNNFMLIQMTNDLRIAFYSAWISNKNQIGFYNQLKPISTLISNCELCKKKVQ